MNLKIKFSNLLAEEIAKEVIIDLPQTSMLTLQGFLDTIKDQSWASQVIFENHLKPSIVLIIDKEIIQFSNSSEMKITKDSEISFHIMFAGGL